MGSRAFVIAGGHAALIANDVNDFRYHAAAHYVPVGVQVPVRTHDRAETQFVVEDGVVEFMIGGAAGLVLSGDFVRVPAGVPYAYRNAGDTTVRILVRAINPAPARRALQVTADFAA
jgi:mannose-6-phosphate isomerase-like protein (cupin superfamily)